MKKVLIVDSHNFYFNIMKKIYEENGFQVVRAKTIDEGWEVVKTNGIDYFNLFVADISIETHLAGFLLAFRLKKAGFKNPIYLASHGFNITLYYFISLGLLRPFGIQRIIPKGVFHNMHWLTLQRFFI